MEPFQIWLVAGSAATLVSGAVGFLIGWIRALDRRITALEIECAVLRAILAERKGPIG